ncbi:MAG: DNA gyrase/topoisomerase IV subunit A [Verrucomicrobiota bacterium]
MSDRSSHLPEVTEMLGEYYADYASYVILDRAVPYIQDGLKPVQRRILHALWEKDDGRFNKVANIIGHTMSYHPHGDASIGDALVQLGQKNLLVETQGNWGNIFTGDSAAAARYIEARLSKFAKEVVFNKKTTHWDKSYDGRNDEPIHLPVKFPLVLAMGVEGIAVGMACKIMPHNFNELCDASIASLKNEPFEILPDFQTGGIADFSDYRDGIQGGRIKVRARIERGDKKSILNIVEIPFGTNTASLIQSIVNASEKGKIKITKVEDLTAGRVRIRISLPGGIDPDTAVDALYAFTDCEISIAPNTAVIHEGKPDFLGVSEILRLSAKHTKALLKWELEIKRDELEEEWHFKSLERLYIEHELYDLLKKVQTNPEAHTVLLKALKPLLPQANLKREVTHDDIEKLLDVQTRRIIRHNAEAADKKLKDIEDALKQVRAYLRKLNDYTIAWFNDLKKRYGKDRARRTEISSFDKIVAAEVAIANETLHLDRKEGFAGYALKRGGDYEVIGKCSRMDDTITFRKNGTMVIQKVGEKVFVGVDPIHCVLFPKEDTTVYCMIYFDKKSGKTYGKKFQIGGVTREREYELVKDIAKSRILFLQALEGPHTPPPTLWVRLKPQPRLRKDLIPFDFGNIEIKGRGSIGNIIADKPIKAITKNRPPDAPAPTQGDLF